MRAKISLESSIISYWGCEGTRNLAKSVTVE
jgi:hypothetical protein